MPQKTRAGKKQQHSFLSKSMENQTQQPTNIENSSQNINPTPPQNPPYDKPKSKFPLGVIIGIIIFLLFAGGAAASFTVFKPQIMKLITKPTPTTPITVQISPSPTPSNSTDTSTWKTYTNTKFGYSVQFPSNWEEGSLGSEDGKGFDYTMVTHGPSDVRIQEIGINTSITDTPAQANSLFETVTKKYSASQLHPIIIDGVQGLSGDNIGDRWAQKNEITQDIFLVKGSIFYLISIGKMDKNLNTTDQILSTFKFTTPSGGLTPTTTQSIDSSWKTYANSQYGFNIKYPSGFSVDDKSTQFPPFTVFLTDKSQTIIGEGGTQTNPYLVISAILTQSPLSNYLSDPQNNLQQTGTKIFNGYTFTNVQEIHGISGATNEYAIQTKNGIILINNPFSQIDANTYTQILSTFRFTQ